MKVTNNIPGAKQSSDTVKTGKAKSSESESLQDRPIKSDVSAGKAAQNERIDLSSRAQDIKKAKEMATPANGIDEAKVARLQSLIDSGRYKVDADAIADRLLDEHSKMS